MNLCCFLVVEKWTPIVLILDHILQVPLTVLLNHNTKALTKSPHHDRRQLAPGQHMDQTATSPRKQPPKSLLQPHLLSATQCHKSRLDRGESPPGPLCCTGLDPSP